MESKYEGQKSTIDKNRWSFDNIGVVFATKIGNQTPLRYVNFGFNYKRSKSFYKNMSMSGMMGVVENPSNPGSPYYVSQTNSMALQATDAERYVWDNSRQHLDFDNANRIFSDPDAGWLGALGYQGGLTERDRIDNEPDLYVPFLPVEPSSVFNSREKGGIDQYDFNVSFNINDRVYLGLTIGAYDVNYSKISTYGEEYGEYIVENVNYGIPSYEMTTENKIDGSGVDFKFGAIVRPFEDSPFRIGVSVHTPTFYNLKIKTNVRAVTYTPDFDSKKLSEAVVDSYDFTNGVDYGYDFRFRTPWKYNLSLGYTYGSSFAIGAEYEYQDYSAMHFSYSDGEAMGWQNPTAKEMLKGVNTFRIGAEWKVIPQFAFRLGYNYMSAAFKKTAFKDLSYNSINTDTDFANAKANNNYTLGIGYRGSTFYADLAYMYSTYKEDFYPFDDGALKKTDVTNSRSKVMMTLGLRF